MSKKNRRKNVLVLVAVLLILVLFIVQFLARPFTLTSNVGKYKNNQTVFGMSTKLLLNRQLHRGDYVIYKSKYSGVDFVGWTELLPGEENTINELRQKDRLLPPNLYGIDGANGDRFTVDWNNIAYLIWFP